MKIGINLLLWTGHVTDEHLPLVDRLHTVGYDGVEIPLSDVADLARYRRIGQVIGEAGLRCTASMAIGDASLNPSSPDPADRRRALDHLRAALDCSHALGADVLMGPFYQVLGQFTGAPPREDELAWCADVHRAAAEHAQAAGLRMAVEPLNRFEAHLLNTLDQAADMVRRVGHPAYCAVFDTFHANIEEKCPIGALTRNMASVGHVHISENDRGTPGEGHGPLRETIVALLEADYAGWLTVEAFSGAVPNLAAATRVWRDFFPSREHVATEGLRFIRAVLGG